MNVVEGKKIKENSIVRFVEVLLAIAFVMYVVPDMKSYFFPDEMTRLEKMLRSSIMERYELAVDRKSDAEAEPSP